MNTSSVFFGGTLIHGIPAEKINHAVGEDKVQAHTVRTVAGSAMSSAVFAGGSNDEDVPVKSNRHQARLAVGQGLTVCARSPDGIVEALENIDRHQVGSRDPVASRRPESGASGQRQHFFRICERDPEVERGREMRELPGHSGYLDRERVLHNEKTNVS